MGGPPSSSPLYSSAASDVYKRQAWGCIDFISAGSGEMKKRYGMIYVDRDNEGRGTLRRIKKDSFDWYRRAIASNGEDLG